MSEKPLLCNHYMALIKSCYFIDYELLYTLEYLKGGDSIMPVGSGVNCKYCPEYKKIL